VPPASGTQRLLLEADKPLRLGSRALDILIRMVERPDALVKGNGMPESGRRE
jgi:DNA-binding winged helix-turn-helix (wHTH) protein